MRSRKVLIIAGFLVTWTYITYYFLLKSNAEYPMAKQTQHSREEKLQNLENLSRMELHKSDKLMVKLLGILKYKYSEEEEKKIQEEIELVKQEQLEQGHPVLGLPEPPANQNEAEQQQIEEIPQKDERNEISTSTSTTTPIPSVTVQSHLANGQPIIPVLVFACNRVSISKCLDNLIQYRPNAEQFPIIVSQDCDDDATRNVIQSYGQQLTLIQQPDQSDIIVPPKEKKFKGYYKIARHYGWALNTTFGKGYEYVIIVEDDLNVAPDFYEYFAGTHHLLKQDSSLW